MITLYTLNLLFYRSKLDQIKNIIRVSVSIPHMMVLPFNGIVLQL